MRELRLERVFDAPREAVFAAWTSPEVLRRWWAAGPGWQGLAAEIDLRPRGRYRLSMENPETGAVHAVAGEYLEVRPPERLVYTWEDGRQPATLVDVGFFEEGGSTRVVVCHRGFAAEDDRAMHGRGWRGCLDNLAVRVLAAKREEEG